MARKISFKENGLQGLTASPEGFAYIGYDAGKFSQKAQTDIVNIGSSGGSSKDVGEIYTSSNSVTGTQSETILVSFKIPAGTYQVGDMMTIGPSVLVYGGYSTPKVSPGPVGNMVPTSYKQLQGYNEPFSYTSTSLTFSQIATDGGGSGVVVQLNFDGGGYISSYNVINGGNGYVINEIITLENKGSGSPQVQVINNYYDNPSATMRAYWSYSENGLDNFCEQVSIDYYNAGFKHIFNCATPSVAGQSGWLPSFSKIINSTTIKYITEQQVTSPYEFIIATCSIPNITQDIYYTITGQLDDINTSLFVGFIKALDDMKTNELYLLEGGSPFSQTITTFKYA